MHWPPRETAVASTAPARYALRRAALRAAAAAARVRRRRARSPPRSRRSNLWPLATAVPRAAHVAVAGRRARARPRGWDSGSTSPPSPPAPTGCTSASTASAARRSGSRCALMLGLVGIMGLYHAALGYAVARWLPRAARCAGCSALPAAWLLIEWWRGWFLSGFSWLSLGYSQTDTWLAGLRAARRACTASAPCCWCAPAR